MKRLLWLGVGLAIGALAVRAISKKAESYTPRGIAAAALDSGRNLADSVRDFVDDVREGMHEREDELHAAIADGVALHEDDLFQTHLHDELAEADPRELHHREGRR